MVGHSKGTNPWQPNQQAAGHHILLWATGLPGAGGNEELQYSCV